MLFNSHNFPETQTLPFFVQRLREVQCLPRVTQLVMEGYGTWAAGPRAHPLKP